MSAQSKADGLREQIEAKRQSNKARFEAAMAAREEGRLGDELAYEEARAKAYEEISPDRVVGGEVKGGGFALFKWPRPHDYTTFVNRGILKTDKLTNELCTEFVHCCRLYPSPERLTEILRTNPAASVALTSKILASMRSDTDAEGNG
jgi:hypothetical protein